MADETPDTSADTPDESGKISYKRFAEVVKERNSLRDGVAAKTSALTEASATLAKAQASAAASEAAWSGKAVAWAEERGLMQHGLVDPEAVDVARALHARLPAEGRPALPDLVGEWKADPAKAPKSLQPWLAPAAAKPAAEPVAAAKVEPAKVIPPTGNAGAGPTSAGPTGAKTAAEIRALSAECQRTGDWAPFLAATGIKRAGA
jgi:hypothetical protein